MTLSAATSLVDQQHFVLDEVSWDFYEHLLAEVGDRPIRITYYNGSVEIMAPLEEHEYWKKRISQLIEAMCQERDIDIIPGGSITFKSRKQDAGLEPDECYYVQRDDNPPPDLAIEIDITSRSIPRQPIYAALGVRELWRFDGTRLIVLHLDPGGRYIEQSASQIFPFLPLDGFNTFLKRFETEKNNAVVEAFRKWVGALS
jgi:Uma2 family endonuclease